MDEQTLAGLRAQRDRAWERVCKVTSTRWDLTKFERLDDDYRRACRDHGVLYVDVVDSTTVNRRPAKEG